MSAQGGRKIIWPISLRYYDYVTTKNWDLRPLRKSNLQNKLCNVSHLGGLLNSTGVFFLLLVSEEYSVEVIYTSSTIHLVKINSHIYILLLIIGYRKYNQIWAYILEVH